MQNKWHEHSVGNIVVNFPLSSAIFRAAGIDYCCGGGRLLGEVIKEQRLVFALQSLGQLFFQLVDVF